MALKQFIKNNVVLIMGLTLPIVLIVLFFLAAVLPKQFSEPPQYRMFYTTSQYVYSSQAKDVFDFEVRDQQIVVKRTHHDDQQNHMSERLFVYDGKRNTVKEIKVDAEMLTIGNAELVTETQDIRIDTSHTSPDGYVLEGPSYNSRGIVGELFGGGRHHKRYRLTKEGVSYKLPEYQDRYYYYNRLDLLGWEAK